MSDSFIDHLTDSLLPRVSSQEWPGGITQYRAACQVAITKYIAELERDKVRLDWVIKYGNLGGCVWRGVEGLGWVVLAGSTQERKPTLREAIDAAMAAQEQPAEIVPRPKNDPLKKLYADPEFQRKWKAAQDAGKEQK